MVLSVRRDELLISVENRRKKRKGMTGQLTKKPKRAKCMRIELPLHNYSADYLVSKKVEKIPMDIPNPDSVPRSRMLILVNSFLEQITATKQFEEMRILRQQRKEQFEKQIEYMKNMCEQLRNAIIKFDPFVDSNKDKRERCERKMGELDFLCRKESIRKLEEDINWYKALKMKIEDDVNDLKIYENYLNEVVNICPNYHHPEDILQRYEALLDARTRVSIRADNLDHSLEETRSRFENLNLDHAETMMRLRTRWAKLQEKKDNVRQASSFWERTLAKAKQVTSMNSGELDMVKQAIWNLYNLTCMRKEIEPELEPTDYEHLLAEIKSSIKVTDKILKKVHSEIMKQEKEPLET